MNRRISLRLSSIGFFLYALEVHVPTMVFAAWISVGDHVVTTVETPVKVQSKVVTMLAPGTNFRAARVQGTWVHVNQEVNGKKLDGWVKRDDLMKLDRNQFAIYATRDNLTRGQFQHIKFPQNLPISVKYESDASIDVFVISDEGLEAMKWIAKKGSGQMTSYYKKWNTREGNFEWNPPDGDQYYLLLDNTPFPDGGANSRRQIHHSVAFCIADPYPAEPHAGRGLLVGRVTLDLDGYEGRHERYREHFNVIVKNTFENGQSETLEIPTDADGYFFLDNVNPDSTYTVEKLDGQSMAAPIPFSLGCSFRGKVATDSFSMESGGSDELKAARNRILDLGCYSLRVDESGKISGSVDSAEFALGYQRNEDGKYSTTVGFSSDTPLDRHDWFLKKFPESGWAQLVRDHRDAVVKDREEEARKKREKEQEKKREAAEENKPVSSSSGTGPKESSEDAPDPPE